MFEKQKVQISCSVNMKNWRQWSAQNQLLHVHVHKCECVLANLFFQVPFQYCLPACIIQQGITTKILCIFSDMPATFSIICKLPEQKNGSETLKVNYMCHIILNLWDHKKNFTNEPDNNHADNFQASYLLHGHVLQPLTNPFSGSVKVVKVQAHSLGITKQSNLT